MSAFGLINENCSLAPQYNIINVIHFDRFIKAVQELTAADKHRVTSSPDDSLN